MSNIYKLIFFTKIKFPILIQVLILNLSTFKLEQANASEKIVYLPAEESQESRSAKRAKVDDEESSDKEESVNAESAEPSLMGLKKIKNVARPKASKFSGVYWNSQNKKWLAQILFNKKNWSIGNFSSEEEAAEEYNKAVYFLLKNESSLNDLPNKDQDQDQDQDQDKDQMQTFKKSVPAWVVEVVKKLHQEIEEKKASATLNASYLGKSKYLLENLNSRKTKTKTSKFSGAFWQSQKQKWMTRIIVNRKTWTIGSFSSEEEAAEEFNKAVYLLLKNGDKLNDLPNKNQDKDQMQPFKQSLPTWIVDYVKGMHEKIEHYKTLAASSSSESMSAKNELSKFNMKNYEVSKKLLERNIQRKSHYHGVVWDYELKKWRAELKNKDLNNLWFLGHFSQEVEAAEEYNKAVCLLLLRNTELNILPFAGSGENNCPESSFVSTIPSWVLEEVFNKHKKISELFNVNPTSLSSDARLIYQYYKENYPKSVALLEKYNNKVEASADKLQPSDANCNTHHDNYDNEEDFFQKEFSAFQRLKFTYTPPPKRLKFHLNKPTEQ